MESKTIKVIEKLRRPDGKIYPADLVKAARDEAHPLHNSFDWDDTAAAQKWRIHQARNIICSVTIEKADTKKVQRVFVNLITDREEGGYRKVADVLSDDDLRAALVKTAIIELHAWKNRHSELMELVAPVWDAAVKFASDKQIPLQFTDAA